MRLVAHDYTSLFAAKTTEIALWIIYIGLIYIKVSLVFFPISSFSSPPPPPIWMGDCGCKSDLTSKRNDVSDWAWRTDKRGEIQRASPAATDKACSSRIAIHSGASWPDADNYYYQNKLWPHRITISLGKKNWYMHMQYSVVVSQGAHVLHELSRSIKTRSLLNRKPM